MGFETDPKRGHTGSVNPGLGLGVTPGLGLIKKMLDYYEGRHFEFMARTKDQTTVVHIATEVLLQNGLQPISGIQQVDQMWIYPQEYFCPINVTTNRIKIQENTRTIHHYAGTWISSGFSFKVYIKKLIPESLLLVFSDIKRRLKDR